jgi:hypothetical protein
MLTVNLFAIPLSRIGKTKKPTSSFDFPPHAGSGQVTCYFLLVGRSPTIHNLLKCAETKTLGEITYLRIVGVEKESGSVVESKFGTWIVSNKSSR